MRRMGAVPVFIFLILTPLIFTPFSYCISTSVSNANFSVLQDEFSIDLYGADDSTTPVDRTDLIETTIVYKEVDQPSGGYVYKLVTKEVRLLSGLFFRATSDTVTSFSLSAEVATSNDETIGLNDYRFTFGSAGDETVATSHDGTVWSWTGPNSFNVGVSYPIELKAKTVMNNNVGTEDGPAVPNVTFSLMATSDDRVSSVEDGAFVHIRSNLFSSGSVIDILKEANPNDGGNENVIDCNGTELTLVEGVSNDDYSGVYLTSGGETEDLLNSDGDFDISGLTIPQGYEFCIAVTLPSTIVSDSTITLIVQLNDSVGTKYMGTIGANGYFETTTYLGRSEVAVPGNPDTYEMSAARGSPGSTFNWIASEGGDVDVRMYGTQDRNLIGDLFQTSSLKVQIVFRS